MSKNLLMGAAVIVLLLLGAGGYMLMSKNKTPTTSPSTSSEEKSNVISSIRDALTGGQSFECTFTDEQGTTTKTYVKNGMVRADMTSLKPEQSGSTIIRDKKMYFWNAAGAFMMEIPDVTTTPGPSGTMSQDEIIEGMEKYKENCNQATVSDALFTPPADVKFQDMSSIMKAIPSGTKTSPAVDQKQIEEMMKQYTTPTGSN